MEGSSRKFYYAVGLSTVSTFLFLSGRFSETSWLDLNVYVFGLYATGNVASKFVNK